jgi:hypothetical protein
MYSSLKLQQVLLVAPNRGAETLFIKLNHYLLENPFAEYLN